MIYGIAGVPGSFKSAYALQKFVIPELSKGRDVYTNIEGLRVERIASVFDIPPLECSRRLHILGSTYDEATGTLVEDRDKVRRFYENIPQNSLVVIDEAQNYFSSRDFKETFSADLIPYLTRHRHYGHDIVWITQSLESVDITFRRNTHITYVFRRMEHLGMKGASMMYIYDRCDTDRAPLSRSVFRVDTNVFKCYDSYVSADVKEQRKSYNIFLHSPFFLLLVAIVIFGLYQVFSGGLLNRIVHPGGKTNRSQQVQKIVPSLPSESKSNSESVESFSDVCIVKTMKFGKNVKYHLSNGNVVTDASMYKSCP